MHRRTSETLGWRPGTSQVRFQAFVNEFDTCGVASLLDIGCGFGDLLAFLRERGWTGQYIGVDIVPEFIAEAHASYVGDDRAEFVVGDFTEMSDLPQCDAALASGLFNHRREADNWACVEDFLARAHAICSRYLAVDFLSETADRRRDDLVFRDAGAILDLGLRYSRRAVLDHGYMPFEFMLKLFWPDDFPDNWPVFCENRPPPDDDPDH